MNSLSSNQSPVINYEKKKNRNYISDLIVSQTSADKIMEIYEKEQCEITGKKRSHSQISLKILNKTG